MARVRNTLEDPIGVMEVGRKETEVLPSVRLDWKGERLKGSIFCTYYLYFCIIKQRSAASELCPAATIIPARLPDKCKVQRHCLYNRTALDESKHSICVGIVVSCNSYISASYCAPKTMMWMRQETTELNRDQFARHSRDTRSPESGTGAGAVTIVYHR